MREASAAWAAEAARLTGARPVDFLEADFGPPGIFRTYTGVAPRDWNGVGWPTGGSLVELSPPRESADRRRNGITARLAARDGYGDSLVADAMAARVGGAASWWRGWLEDDGGLVQDPVCLFHGEVASVRLDAGEGGGRVVVVEVEQELRDLDRAQRHRMTAASQAAIDPTDRFFEHLKDLATNKPGWGTLYYNREREP